MASVAEKKGGEQIQVGQPGTASRFRHHSRRHPIGIMGRYFTDEEGRFCYRDGGEPVLQERRLPPTPHRRVMTFSALWALGPAALESCEALLLPDEFIKLVEAVSGHSVDRQTLQFYSSPRGRLIPPPNYRFRHRSHYLHPEHTYVTAVVLHLRRRYFFPVSLAREVVRAVSPKHYDLILRDALNAEEIRLLASSGTPRITPEALMSRRILRPLWAPEAVDKGGLSGALGGLGILGGVKNFCGRARGRRRIKGNNRAPGRSQKEKTRHG
ncbi:MAG: hypothetical protein HY921_12095 [Elusimicrobia bacterium]|nr:hypothetical protein [Elusimicrobiota bacterium]